MQLIRQKIRNLKVNASSVDALVGFMIKEKPLGEFTYEFLRMLNRSMFVGSYEYKALETTVATIRWVLDGDSQVTINDKREEILEFFDDEYMDIRVYSHLLTSMETILKNIIIHNGVNKSEIKKFNTFIIKEFFSKVMSKNPGKEDELKKEQNDWLAKIDDGELLKPKVDCEVIGDLKFVNSLLPYYLSYAAKNIKERNEKSPIANDVNKLKDDIENARNVFVHSGAIIKVFDGRWPISVRDFNVKIFAFIAECYSAYTKPTIWTMLSSRWVILGERIRRAQQTLTNIWKSLSEILGDWYKIVRGVFSLVWASGWSMLKCCVTMIVAVVIMSGVGLVKGAYNSVPFEEATYEDLKSVTNVEWARMHKRRADIAKKLKYEEGKSAIADKIHKRTEEFNEYASSMNGYPHILEYMLPFVADKPVFSKLDSIVSWNNALCDIPEDYDDDGFLLPRYDNPISAEIYGNYYFCNFINLRRIISSPDNKTRELQKIERLCEIVKSNSKMELYIVYNPIEDEDCAILQVATTFLKNKGLTDRQLKILKEGVDRGPKLYLRMDKRY